MYTSLREQVSFLFLFGVYLPLIDCDLKGRVVSIEYQRINRIHYGFPPLLSHFFSLAIEFPFGLISAGLEFNYEQIILRSHIVNITER